MILLRHPALPPDAMPGRFERDAAAMCSVIGLDYQWCIPYLSEGRPGRKAVWDRDMDMLSKSDLALCFYDVGQIGNEESGTVALVDKAVSMEVPVYAYAVTAENAIIRVGEHDPQNLWAERVPAA